MVVLRKSETERKQITELDNKKDTEKDKFKTELDDLRKKLENSQKQLKDEKTKWEKEKEKLQKDLKTVEEGTKTIKIKGLCVVCYMCLGKMQIRMHCDHNSCNFDTFKSV